MPHKKNPDVFELVRARCNQLQALPNDIALATANLPSGYHRDMQLLKESLFPSIGHLKDCLQMMRLMIEHMVVKENILEDEKYKFLFSVEEVNKLVLSGIPFRDAYKKIGLEIAQEIYNPATSIQHTHEGSAGNLCTKDILRAMSEVVAGFNFERADAAFTDLLA
jgi:argininosuccinate lyase